MILKSTRPPQRLRCRQCGSTSIQPSTSTKPTRKPHHTPDIYVSCLTCGHSWYSKARAAQTLHHIALEAIGQTVIAWDEQPLKKPLTRPPLPD